jgi:hypothetical protein
MATPKLDNITVKRVYEHMRRHFKKDPAEMTQKDLNQVMEKRIAESKKEKEQRMFRNVSNLMKNKENQKAMMDELKEYQWVKSRRGDKTFRYARRRPEKGQARWTKDETEYFKRLEQDKKLPTETKVKLMEKRFDRPFTKKSLYMKRFRLSKVKK